MPTFQNCNVKERFMKDSSLRFPIKTKMKLFRFAQEKREETRARKGVTRQSGKDLSDGKRTKKHHRESSA
jgi:hypothetical protein